MCVCARARALVLKKEGPNKARTQTMHMGRPSSPGRMPRLSSFFIIIF